MTSSTGRSRRPLGPARVATAPAAMSAGTLSAAGEPLQRLPPSVARPCTWVEPIRLAASTTPGHTCLSRGCSFSSAPVTAAPMRQPPFSSVTVRVSRILLMSTISSGSTMSARIWTRRSVPPASTRASPLAPASRATAPSSDSGASYRIGSGPSVVGVCAGRYDTARPGAGDVPRDPPRRGAGAPRFCRQHAMVWMSTLEPTRLGRGDECPASGSS